MKSILLTTTLLLTTFATKCCGTYCKIPKAEPVSQEEGLKILKNIGEYMAGEPIENNRICAYYKSKTKSERDSTTITRTEGALDYNPADNELYYYAKASEQIDLEYTRGEKWILNKGCKTYDVTAISGSVVDYTTREYETKEDAFKSIGSGISFVVIITSTVYFGVPQSAYDVYRVLTEAITGKTIDGEDIDEEDKTELVDWQFKSTGEPGNIEYSLIFKDQDNEVTEMHGKYVDYYGTEYSISINNGISGEYEYQFTNEVERVPLPEKPEDSTSNN